MKRFLLAALLLGATSLSSSALAGEGLVRGIEAMPKSARQALASDILIAKREHATIFRDVDALRSAMPKLDKGKRGRFAVISPTLVALGKEAGPALLEKLALTSDAHPDLTNTAFTGWRLGLIEALGKLREERAIPVLAAVVKGTETDADLLKSTTMALARIGTKDALEPLFSAPSDKRLFALSALGECRQEVTASVLAKELATTTDPNAQAAIIDALGRVGSSWAWSTPNLVKSGAGDTVRTIAARALVQAAPQIGDALRPELELALAMVEHPDTRTMIAAEKLRVSPTKAHALDALNLRF